MSRPARISLLGVLLVLVPSVAFAEATAESFAVFIFVFLPALFVFVPLALLLRRWQRNAQPDPKDKSNSL
jgi:hypothetical protein